MQLLLFVLLLVAPSLQQGEVPECICVQEMEDVISPTVIIGNPQGDRMYVGTQEGLVYVYSRADDDGDWVRQEEVFMDLREIVRINDGYTEEGFLSLNFHPDFEENRRLFVYYSVTLNGDQHFTRLSQLLVQEDDRDSVDINSEFVLLDIFQFASNHNGGEILWAYSMFPEEEQDGKRGYMLLTVGDGGGGGDPEDNGQNVFSLQGNVLMIDVDNPEGDKNYGIPDENPFKNNQTQGLEEIFAYGLRNPWRNSVDSETQRMFIADVGQNKIEEIDIMTMANSGGNFGWAIYEGTECYNANEKCSEDDEDDYLWPIYEYDHSSGSASVTGGYVYRGDTYQNVYGDYYYADWVRGTIGQLREDSQGNWEHYDVQTCGDCSSRNSAWQDNYDQYIQTFGVDDNGDIFFGSKSTVNSDGPGHWYRMILDPDQSDAKK